MLEDEGSTSHSCEQHVKVCSIHNHRPVLMAMKVQTSSFGINECMNV